MLVSESSWRTPSIKDYPTPFLFQFRETLNGKDLRVFSEKERVDADRLSNRVCIRSLLQFDIDVALELSIGGSHFGAEGILYSGHAPSHRGVAETDTRVMSRLRRSPRRQQGKPRTEHRQGAGIPSRSDDGRRMMMQGQPTDRLLMGMERVAMQHGALDDRNTMLKNLRCGLHDGVRWHANKCCVDISHPTDVGSNRNVSERLRKLSPGTGCSTHEGRQAEVVEQGNEFRADLPHSAISDDCKTQRLR